MRIITSLLIIFLISPAASAQAKKQFDLDGVWQAWNGGQYKIRGQRSLYDMQGVKQAELFPDNKSARKLAVVGRNWRDDVHVSASNDMMVGKNNYGDVVWWIKVNKRKNKTPLSVNGQWIAHSAENPSLLRDNILYDILNGKDKRIGGLTVRDKKARKVLLTGPDWRDELIISRSGDTMAGKNHFSDAVWWRKVGELQPLPPKIAAVPQRPNNPAPPQNIVQPEVQQENEEPLEPFSLDDDPIEEEATGPPPTDPEGILDRAGLYEGRRGVWYLKRANNFATRVYERLSKSSEIRSALRAVNGRLPTKTEMNNPPSRR